MVEMIRAYEYHWSCYGIADVGLHRAISWPSWPGTNNRGQDDGKHLHGKLGFLEMYMLQIQAAACSG